MKEIIPDTGPIPKDYNADWMHRTINGIFRNLTSNKADLSKSINDVASMFNSVVGTATQESIKKTVNHAVSEKYETTSILPAPKNVTALGTFGGSIIKWDDVPLANETERRRSRDCLYRVYRATANDSTTASAIKTTGSNFYKDSFADYGSGEDIAVGTTLYYWVKTVNKLKQEGNFSDVTTCTVGRERVLISDGTTFAFRLGSITIWHHATFGINFCYNAWWNPSDLWQAFDTAEPAWCLRILNRIIYLYVTKGTTEEAETEAAGNWNGSTYGWENTFKYGKIGDPSTPTGLNGGSIIRLIWLEWDRITEFDPTLKEIKIYRNGTYLKSVSAYANFAFDANINIGVNYTYKLKLTNTLGEESDFSSEVTIKAIGITSDDDEDELVHGFELSFDETVFSSYNTSSEVMTNALQLSYAIS